MKRLRTKRVWAPAAIAAAILVIGSNWGSRRESGAVDATGASERVSPVSWSAASTSEEPSEPAESSKSNDDESPAAGSPLASPEPETEYARALPQAPSPAELKRAYEAEPHSTPEALLAFADGLAAPMQQALGDRSAATRLSRWLDHCARASDSAHAVRALCLANLIRLGEKHGGSLVSVARKTRSSVEKRVSILAAPL